MSRPPDLILCTRSQGFTDMLRYVRMPWTIEQDLASAEDIRSYWEEAAPIWEVSPAGARPLPNPYASRYTLVLW